jgi:hypothetical protein
MGSGATPRLGATPPVMFPRPPSSSPSAAPLAFVFGVPGRAACSLCSAEATASCLQHARFLTLLFDRTQDPRCPHVTAGQAGR